MKNYIFFYLALFVLTVGPILETRAQAVFKGTVDPALQIDSIELMYATTQAQIGKIFTLGIPRTCKVENGRFQMDFPKAPGVFYLLISPNRSKDPDVARIFSPISSHNIRMGNTDTLDLRITKKGIFPGSGTSRSLKCQMDLIELNEKNIEERIELYRSYRLEEDTVNLSERALKFFSDHRKFYDCWENQIRKIVKEDYSDLPKETADAIMYNKIGKARTMEIANLGFKVERGSGGLRLMARKYYLEHYLGQKRDTSLLAYPGGAPDYTSFLYMKTVYDLLVAQDLVERNMAIQLPPVLAVIEKRFKGQLYDEVAFAAFLERASKRYVDPKTYSILTSQIQTPEFRDYIVQQRDRSSEGSKFFQYELPNEYGRTVSNRDLLGKVVIYDFWFTGCHGCADLSKSMEPIKAHFKDNPNVVFVSISIDNEEDVWKRSLKSGNYSHQGDTNLWLGKLSDSHPMILHYSINSYPTQIIVDADNRIVAMNPPDVRRSGEEKAFVGMVQQALDKYK